MNGIKEAIEGKLNISMDNLARNHVTDLNETSDLDIERARLLDNENEAEYYLSLLVTDENLRYLKGFVRNVITNNENHRTWGKGRVLLLECSMSDVLTKDRMDLYQRPEALFKCIVEPDLESWKQYSDRSGSFAFYEPDTNYKDSVTSGYYSIAKSVHLLEVPSNKVTLYFRRWLASKIAAYLKHFNQLSAHADVSKLEELAAHDTWTEDARRALSGLLKELESPSEGIVPGYSGPDDFYE